MLIGKERIKGLVPRNIASGIAYYWQPDPRERKAGWPGFAAGTDLATAISLAKQRNAEVDQWRTGGARPKAVARYTAAKTFGALLDRYEQEKLVGLAASTQRVDKTQLAYLRDWAGQHPVKWITRARVRALKLAICPDADKLPRMLRDGARNVPGHNPAFKLLSKGREVFTWAMDHPEGLATANPFERFALPKPPPRDQRWERDAVAAFTASAHALGYPSIGFALRLAINYGQREADLLALNATAWREIDLRQLGLDRELFAALASDHGPDAGKVMGLYVRQGKTRRMVGVPIAGDLRDEVEAAIAAGAARARKAAAEGKPVPIGATRLIVRDRTGEKWRGRDLTGEPWPQRDFIDKVAEIRAHAAAAARKAGNEALATRLDDLEFRDARRTCVTLMGDLGLDNQAIAARTGHSLKTIEQILETYMVRTEAQAGRGTVAMLGADTRRKAAEEKERKG